MRRYPVMNPIYFDEADKEEAHSEGWPYYDWRSTVTNRFRLKRHACSYRSRVSWYITV